MHTWRQVVPPWLGKSAFGGGRHDALPGRHQGLALCFGSSPLTHRFTVHNTGPTSAYPGHYPGRWLLRASVSPTASGWHLLRGLTSPTEGRWGLPRSQFPLLASLGRCFPPGFLAVLTGQYVRLPAPYPVPFGSSASASCAGSFSRWLIHTFACAAHRCLLDGIPGLRLPGSAVYPRIRPLRTRRQSGDMLSLLHLEGGTCTLMETELQSLWLCDLPEDISPLSINGSHGHINGILSPAPLERNPENTPGACQRPPPAAATRSPCRRLPQHAAAARRSSAQPGVARRSSAWTGGSG
jgi:hypothetical protein